MQDTTSQPNKHSARVHASPHPPLPKLKYQKMGEEGRLERALQMRSRRNLRDLEPEVLHQHRHGGKPEVSNQEAEKMYEDAVEHTHHGALRDLETIWMRCTEG